MDNMCITCLHGYEVISVWDSSLPPLSCLSSLLCSVPHHSSHWKNDCLFVTVCGKVHPYSLGAECFLSNNRYAGPCWFHTHPLQLLIQSLPGGLYQWQHCILFTQCESVFLNFFQQKASFNSSIFWTPLLLGFFLATH